MSRVISDLGRTLETAFGISAGTIDASGLTAARGYELPDKSGVIALLSDIDGGGSMIEAIPLTLSSVGQTSIAVPGGYADSAIIVVRNGALLDVDADYTATDDINIVLQYPITSLAEAVTVYRLSTFNVANTYSQTQVNALLAAKQSQITELQESVALLETVYAREVTAKLSTPATNDTVTLTDLMTLDIPAAGVYELAAVLRFRTPATTTGIGLALVAGSGAITAQLTIAQAVAGTASFFEGSSNASGVTVLSTAVLAANTDYPAIIRGSFVATAATILALRFRSEVASSLVTVQANSFFRAREVR